jgi:hypothetical protein
MRKEDRIKRNMPCEAVELLVKRMDEHYDEFRLEPTTKWGSLMNVVKRRVIDKDANALIVLDDFECEMLWSKFRAAGKKQLHNYVMEKILEGNDGKQ